MRVGRYGSYTLAVLTCTNRAPGNASSTRLVPPTLVRKNPSAGPQSVTVPAQCTTTSTPANRVHDLGQDLPQPGGRIPVRDDGEDHLLVSGLGVGQPDDGRLPDPVESGDRGLVQAGVEVELAPDQHVLLAARQHEAALLVEPGQVPGRQLGQGRIPG